MKIKIHKSSDDQFYFTIVASNGEPLATSETYTTKENCKHTAALIKNDAMMAEVIDLNGDVL